jgi:hypothetical protein
MSHCIKFHLCHILTVCFFDKSNWQKIDKLCDEKEGNSFEDKVTKRISFAFTFYFLLMSFVHRVFHLFIDRISVLCFLLIVLLN